MDDKEIIKAIERGRDKVKKIRYAYMTPEHKKNGMETMPDYLYKFLSLSCGSIAHYNKYGWIETYPTIGSLKAFFKRNEFGQSVRNHIPRWKTDAIEAVKAVELLLGI